MIARNKKDGPRERLLKYGSQTLTDSELLAVILRAGVKGADVLTVGRTIMQRFKTFSNMADISLNQWRSIKGLGEVKIAQLQAVIELARRLQEEQVRTTCMKVSSAADVHALLLPRMRDLKRECFKLVLLSAQNHLIEVIDIAEGTVNEAYPIAREIFHKALDYFATSIICVHNHPSQDPDPSLADMQFTERLVQGGAALHIGVLDHIIIAGDTFYSFADNGLMNGAPTLS